MSYRVLQKEVTGTYLKIGGGEERCKGKSVGESRGGLNRLTQSTRGQGNNGSL